MKRTALVAVLVALYGIVWLRGEFGSAPRGFDPFAPRARLLAQRLGAGQYQDALPLAQDLDLAFPGEPEVQLALARIWHGLRDWSQEAEAWERYVRISSTPAEACPALAAAYETGRQQDRATDAYERCARFDPDDPEGWFDLAQVYARRGRRGEALAILSKAAALDPDNPWIQAAIARESAGQ